MAYGVALAGNSSAVQQWVAGGALKMHCTSSRLFAQTSAISCSCAQSPGRRGRSRRSASPTSNRKGKSNNKGKQSGAHPGHQHRDQVT